MASPKSLLFVVLLITTIAKLCNGQSDNDSPYTSCDPNPCIGAFAFCNQVSPDEAVCACGDGPDQRYWYNNDNNGLVAEGCQSRTILCELDPCPGVGNPTCEQTGPTTTQCNCPGLTTYQQNFDAADQRGCRSPCWHPDDQERCPSLYDNQRCSAVTATTFRCDCIDGFTETSRSSDTQVECGDLDECSDPALSDCDDNASCTNQFGSFRCRCNAPFTGDGQTCTLPNPCDNSVTPCGPNTDCATDPDDELTAICTCRNGYSGDPFDSTSGCDTFDPCDDSVTVCGPNTDCDATAEVNFRCTCRDGFEGDPFIACDPSDPIDDPCDGSVTPCGPNTDCATAPDDGMTAICTCRNGYSGDPFDSTSGCDTFNPCDDSVTVCGPNTNCDATAEVNFRCTCIDGFEGDPFIGCDMSSVTDPPAPTDPPINNVGALDDPHFKTWSGSFYDYMGACDIKLIHVDCFDRGQNNICISALDIYIRTKTRYDYSFIESAVVRIGNETFEVGSFADYFLNGVEGTRLPNHISGYPIKHKQLNKKTHVYTIELGGDETIHLRTFKDWVSVTLSNPSKERYQNSYGMMGQFGTGKLFGRDGVTIIEDPNALADEWQIRDTEPMLFQTARAPQYPEHCKMPTSASTSTTSRRRRRRLGGVGGEKQIIPYEAAEKACLDAGVENKEGCIRDVIAIGDLDLAQAGAF